MNWGWFLTGLLLGAAGIVGWANVGVRRRSKPLRMPQREARCAPETQTAATRVQVHGARETYSHPQADVILRERQFWTTGGRA